MNNRVMLFIPVTCGLAFFLGLQVGGFQLVLLQTAQTFQLDTIMMGGLVAAQFSAITLGPLFFGWAADRFGNKKILLICMPLFIVGCFGAAVSNTAMMFAGMVFIAGIGYSVTECISSSALSDSFPNRVSRYLNLMQCFFCLGAVASPLIFNILISAFLVSWRAVFFTAGGGYILLYPLLMLSRCEKQHLPEESKAESPSRFFSVFLISLVAAMLIYVSMEMGVSFFADSMFAIEYSNTSLGAYAISGFWFSMMASRLVFALIKMKPQTMVMLGFFVCFLLFIILLLFRNQWVLLGVIILLGFVLGPVWPMLMGIGTSSYKQRSGTVASILAASGGLGGVISPVVIGFVAKHAGFYGSFWLFAAVSLFGFILMWFYRKI